MKRILKTLGDRIRPLTQSKKQRRHALVGPPELWKMKRDFQIRFLQDMGLKPEHHLLDIGCGTLRGGIPLIEYLQEGHYFGVEARTQALDEGRKELKGAGLRGKNPTLLLAPDISEIVIDRNFDYIWSFSVLFHMTDEIVSDTLSFVSSHLSGAGAFYANVIAGNGKIGNWREFPVVARSLQTYVEASAMYGLLAVDLGSLKEFGHISNVEFQDNQRMLKITKS